MSDICASFLGPIWEMAGSKFANILKLCVRRRHSLRTQGLSVEGWWPTVFHLPNGWEPKTLQMTLPGLQQGCRNNNGRTARASGHLCTKQKENSPPMGVITYVLISNTLISPIPLENLFSSNPFGLTYHACAILRLLARTAATTAWSFEPVKPSSTLAPAAK